MEESFPLPTAHVLGPDYVVGLFESQARMQNFPFPAPEGLDAVQVEYLPPHLATGLVGQGYDPAIYCANLRQSLASER